MSGWNKHEEEIRGEFVQPVTCAHGSTPNCRVNMSPVIHPSCTTRHRLPQWHILNLTAVTGSSRLLRAAELWRRAHWRCRHDGQLHCLFDLWKKEWQSAFCTICSLFLWPSVHGLSTTVCSHCGIFLYDFDQLTCNRENVDVSKRMWGGFVPVWGWQGEISVSDSWSEANSENIIIIHYFIWAGITWPSDIVT